MPRTVLIEGYTPEEILGLSDELLDSLALSGEPLVFRAGSAEILGELVVKEGKLVLELAHIDGGGEGVLATLALLAERYAQRRGLGTIEWIVHATACASPNLRLRKVLERRGFVVEDVPGKGLCYHRCVAVGP
jgi:hypothetical protein